MTVLDGLRGQLRQLANPEKARVLQRFFKTRPGEYGEGDVFLGITVPEVRKLARRYQGLSLEDTEVLLHSPLHEERLLALLVLVESFRKADAAGRTQICSFYLNNSRWVNNWDLVDLSAPSIAGPCLSGGALDRLAHSANLWERRIAMLATFQSTREGDAAPALRIAEALLADDHDLIHKAVGWMLREVGKRCGAAVLEGFLDRHYRRMPRTALRYSIERLPRAARRHYMAKPGVRTSP